MVADDVIYIPRKFARDIFLFEDLKVYSIRDAILFQTYLKK